MTLLELARLVRDMRATQKRYFREGSAALLEESKAKEKALDEAVAEVLDGPTLPFGEGRP